MPMQTFLDCKIDTLAPSLLHRMNVVVYACVVVIAVEGGTSNTNITRETFLQSDFRPIERSSARKKRISLGR